MRAELKELWRFRELLLSLVEREIKIRYKNSFLGFLWSLLNPLITAVVMSTVFRYFLEQTVPSYGLYVLAAYLPFLFFQSAVLDSAQSVLIALPMVRKVYFPREVLPLAQILANFVHLLLAMVIFVVISCSVWILYPGEFPIKATVIFVPLFLVINLMLATGCGLLVSALNTFYEDVKYMVSALLYIMFFVTPVMYFSEKVTYELSKRPNGQLLNFLYHLNPMATLCTAYRKAWLAPTPIHMKDGSEISLTMNWPMIGVAAMTSFIILVFGYSVFNRLKWKFVERP